MIDIHCHILPGVDDGAKNLDMSITMARAFVEDGVHTVVATSHLCNVFFVERSMVHRKLAEVRSELERQGIPLTVLPGNEVRLESTKFFYEAMEEERFCFLADNPAFLLLEQAWEGFNPDSPGIVKDLAASGTQVIVAHPERHAFFRAAPELLERMLAEGAWTQVNVGSLLGDNGPDAQSFAFELADRGLLHTLGTDAHNMRRRPNLSLGYRAIEERLGSAAADAIRGRMATIIAGSVERR